MPVRPGTPQGHPGRLQLFDPMAAKPTLKSYESVLEGNPFSSGRLGGQSAHSLYGIAPERNAVRKRSASTSSLESTDEGLTKSRKGGLIKR